MTSIPRADEPSLIDEPSVVHALRVTLVIFFASALVISAVTLFLRWRLTPQLALAAGASSLVALVLSRSGRIRPAMMLPLLFIAYAVLTLAVRSDGIQNIGLAILPVLILVGSLVLDRLTLVFFTASIILAVVGMLAIRYFVLLAERYSTNDMGDLFIFAITCATAALVGRLFALRIKEGFRRAQAYSQALGQAERNVRLATDSLSEMVVAYDMHRSLTYANKAAEKLTGYGHAELQVADPLSWTHPEDRSQVLALWDKAFDGQTLDQVVYRLITKNGEVRWAAGSWGPVVDETGQQVGVRGTCHDITERMVAEEALQETTQKFRTIVEEIAERKRVEQALRESEEHTRLAMEAGRMFAFEWSPLTDEVRRSYDCSAITGSTSDATVEAGRESLKRVHPNDQERLIQTIGSLTPANDRYEIEYRVIRPGGQIATLQQSSRAFFDSSAVMIRLIGITADITERKQAETALRESEERFRAIFSQAAVGIAQTSPDGEWLVLNGRFCEILGYSQAELCGKTFLDVTHPDDREASLGAIRRILAGEISSWSTEKRYVRKDGTIVWGRLWVSLVRDQDNRPQYFIAVVEDVTERIQADRALRDSERRLMLAQSAAHIGIWEGDLRTNQKKISEEYAKLYGLPPDKRSLTYEEWLSLIHPNDRERLRTQIGESVERIGSWDTEFRAVWPDGSVHWLLTKGTVIFDDSGEPVRSAGVNLDITERKQAEEQRSYLAAIVESSDDAIIGRTLDGEIVSWNPGAERIYGYKAEEMVGQPISLLVPRDRPDEIPSILERLRHGERLEHHETTRVRKDGRRIEVSGTISPIRDSTGAVVGASAISRDITEQKQAEATLRESEERFRNMADTAPVMIWVCGPDKGFTFFNKTRLDFTGHAMEQELGDGWANGVHPDDLDRCFATYSSSFDARRTFQMEYRLRRADGEYRWVLDNGVPLYRGGEFAGFIGSCVDISEQKLIEERLRANEVQLKDAQRLAKVGSWELDVEADRMHWSDEIPRMFGLPNGAPSIVPTLLNCVHPKDREKILEADRKVRSSIAPVDVEYRIIRPEGEMRFVRSIVEAIRNDRGAVIRIVGATQDITEQVKARELLRESEKRLRNAERLAHVGNWHWDISGNLVACSDETLRILGNPQDYTPGFEGFLQAVIPQDRERVHQWGRNCLAKKTGRPIEFQIARSNGDLRTITCTCEVLLNEDGLPVHMVGTCQDVTDSRRAEATVRRSLDEVAHLNRVAAMGELTASLAHELNQPLAAILSNAQAANRFLNRESPNLAQVRECLTDIVADDKRAGEVIKTLRALLRKGESQASLGDLNDVVTEAIRLLGTDAMLRHASVKFEPLPALRLVRGDRTQLYQVVLNLIVNGLEATAERPPSDRWVLVRTAESDGDRVQLTVEDSGKGIAEGDLSRPFEPFFTTKREGLGMGLSISRTIVQAHGGQIWAENSAGHGAIFHCVLPVAQQGAAAATL